MRLLTTFLFISFTALSLSSILSALRKDGSGVNNAATCVGCKAGVLFLRTIYGTNRTREFLIKVAAFICRNFVHEESLVCNGLATQFRDEILFVVNELILKPDVLCSMFIGHCGKPENDTSSWNIKLPSKRPGQQYPTYPTMRQKNIRALHITDLHLDPKYEPGSEADCEEDLCCHMQPGKNESSVKQKSGYWGSLAVCDIPYWTVENMLQNIKQLGKIDYIMVGGDYESHMDWTYTREDHLGTIRNLSAMLHHYFPNTPIYWTLGNHEGVPIDSFAPHYVPEKYRPQWLYDELIELQKPLLDKKSVENIKYRGSYVTQLYPGLRLISLNSGYCETFNFWLYINETDPDGTLSWLVSELDQAELDGQYVHILSHIPPGDDECLESWARNYYKIIARYSKTIKAQYFGHIHVDSFTVFYENMNDDSSEPISLLYASPSVTTFKYLNPAFRIYEIESGINYRVVNFHTYFLNLSKTQTNTAVPRWELLYSAKEDYNLTDLSPSSWNHFINRITYEKKAYDKFIRQILRQINNALTLIFWNSAKNSDKTKFSKKLNSFRQDNFVCEGKCRFESLCFLRKGHHNVTLCNHIDAKRTTDAYKLARISNNSWNAINPEDSAYKKRLLIKEENPSKKSKANIMKKIIQLLLSVVKKY